MRNIILSCLVLLLALSGCSTQTKTPSKKLYNGEFKWTIEIPENYKNVSASDWNKIQNIGADAIENTFGEEIVERPNTIFVFKNNRFNYLESNWQPFDAQVDGDYIESCKNVNEILYETFKSQMSGAIIDSTSGQKIISGLEFQTFIVKINIQNSITIHSISYSRLFGKKDFSVNIMYVDEKQGEKMLKAWNNSKFE